MSNRFGFLIAHLNISRLVLWLFGAIIVANSVAVFAEEGLHWTLPDDPDSYRLFDLLRG